MKVRDDLGIADAYRSPDKREVGSSTLPRPINDLARSTGGRYSHAEPHLLAMLERVGLGSE